MRRVAAPLSLCLLVFVCEIFAGCERFAGPSTVVNSLYRSCNDGDYPKVRGLVAAPLRDKYDGAVTSSSPGIKGACDRLTKSGNLASVQVQSEAVEGYRAAVVVDVRYKDDSVKKGELTQLVQESGVWKIVW